MSEQAKKIYQLMRAKLGLNPVEEPTGVIINPERIEERTRVKMQQVYLHTQMRYLHKITGLDHYKTIVEEFDEYLISLDGLSRQEYITEKQSKQTTTVQPVAMVPQSEQGKDKKEKDAEDAPEKK